jgi:hypothetical protein
MDKLKNIDIEAIGAVTNSTLKAFIMPRTLTMAEEGGPGKGTQR